ncbi:hypothetical protein [Kitasatospora sp. NPDC057500]|uniref:hypothetical protein n=1 Tax=Kitasatospora sp. NPDC057500 TaxID=3346151 RepID=UPI00368518BF
MDQSQAPVLEALAAFHANPLVEYLRSGPAAGMLVPDSADPGLESLRVVVEDADRPVTRRADR